MSMDGRQRRAVLRRPSDGSKRLTLGEALGYVKEVKEEFKNTPEKYDEFLAVIKALQAQRLDRADVVARLRYLFKGHQSLVLGLNTFLPKDYEIAFLPLENSEATNFHETINFTSKIKTRVKDATEYKTFLRLLDEYKMGSMSLREFYLEVEELFNYQPDIVEEFRDLLPYDIPFPNLIPNVSASAGPFSGRIIGVSSVGHSQLENVLKQKEKPVTSQNNLVQSIIVIGNEEWKYKGIKNEHRNKAEKKGNDREKKLRVKGETETT